ncbi:MAG: twin-arginine translocase subunit TatC [Bdellovibrionota bacterium]
MSEKSKNEMPFLDHLGELRIRLLYIFIAVIITSSISYLYAQELFDIFTKPYRGAFPDDILIGTGPAEAFLLKLKSSITAGFILASPLIFIQIWIFIAPGLESKEKLFAIPFILFSSLLFIGGIYFCYAAVLPFAFDFFKEQYTSIDLKPTIRISEYFALTVKSMLGFGLVFETPILAYFLGRLGIISSSGLINAGRYAIVIIFLISAMLTPPDVLTQFLMAGPLLILYGLSIIIVRFTENKVNENN